MADERLVPLQSADWMVALRSATEIWADVTTAASRRRADIQRDKRRTVASFFAFVDKRPGDVTPDDVRAWTERMREQRLAVNSIYTRVSLLSSFYAWAALHMPNGDVRDNPVRVGRPRRPHAYGSESATALDDDEVRALVRVVRERAGTGDLVGKRDFALLLVYLLTGMRREEVIRLRGKDVEIKEDRIVVKGRVKGGAYVGREVEEPLLRDALLDYLRSATRLSILKTDEPLWTRHDSGGKPGAPLSSYAFVHNLKRYGAAAGLEHVHLHQTRHTFARMVAENTGSLLETQDALGHQSLSTTRAYVQRIAVKRDKHSRAIADRIR
jgi:integrase